MRSLKLLSGATIEHGVDRSDVLGTPVQLEDVADDDKVEYDVGQEPSGRVEWRDQTHVVVVEDGVIPGTGVELCEHPAGGKLPDIAPDGVDGRPH